MKILFIDDEAYYTKAYRDELRKSGCEVVFEDSVPRAATLLAEMTKGQHDLIVLDLQMPRPENMPDAANIKYVELTGLWLLGEFAEKIKKLGIPVAILTNVNPTRFEAVLPSLAFSARNLKVFRKIDTPARNLPDALRSFVKDTK